MSGRARSDGARAWSAAVREADSALVCLQSGCPAQAAQHLERGRRLLAGEETGGKPAGPGAEVFLQEEARARGPGGQRAARQALGQLARDLGRHPGRQQARGGGVLDRLQGRQRLAAVIGFFVAAVLLGMCRGAPTPPEERSLVGALRGGGPVTLDLTLEQVQARLPPGPFSHLDQGFRFTGQVTIRLGKARPLYAFTMGLRNAMVHRVSLWRGTTRVHRFYLGPRAVPIGLFQYEVDLARTSARQGVDRIVVQGVEGEGSFELGQVTIEDWR